MKRKNQRSLPTVLLLLALTVTLCLTLLASCDSEESDDSRTKPKGTATFGFNTKPEGTTPFGPNTNPGHTHTEEIIPGKAATCTETGLTEGKKCTSCGETLVEQVIIPAKGHTLENNVCKICGVKVSKGLEYTLNSDKQSYSVVGIGACTDIDIVIPLTYNGKPVTSIGDWAFHWCTSLTSITIPDSVTSIGDNAFYDCHDLTSITIGNSVTSIGEYAFSGCTSLTSISIPDSVMSIGDGAFSGCESLKYNEYGYALYLGNTNNPYVALVNAKNKSITTCIIHESTRFISGFAFYGCASLTSITVPNSVKSIGEQAFSCCNNLTNIIIPDSVTSIGNSAFSDCTSLTSITFGGTVEQWNRIEKGNFWNEYTGNYKVYCTDGTADKKAP